DNRFEFIISPFKWNDMYTMFTIVWYLYILFIIVDVFSLVK
ncbi:MAG: hypothetical protein K0R50_3898, partial [Eubacterium sp.]|nr:hypothetical protein [Eubacterium sp.]